MSYPCGFTITFEDATGRAETYYAEQELAGVGHAWFTDDREYRTISDAVEAMRKDFVRKGTR